MRYTISRPESMDESHRAICKGCHKPIVWGMTTDGTKVPLDPTPPVYAVRQTERMPDGTVRILRLNTEEAMVSHFSTCTHAEQFSRGRR